VFLKAVSTGPLFYVGEFGRFSPFQAGLAQSKIEQIQARDAARMSS
jgi:hypothetical protein